MSCFHKFFYQPRYTRIALVAVASLLVSAVTALGQHKTGVSMDRIAGPGESYTISYVPPASSAYATWVSTDTLFCATVISGLHGQQGVVVPMQRIDSALYTARLDVPDSTYNLRIEICRPTDRVPDGILDVGIVPDNGPPWPSTAMSLLDNADSALRFERAMYPWNYIAYYQYWSAVRPASDASEADVQHGSRRLDSLITVVAANTDATFNRYLTLALLHGARAEGVANEHRYLDSAVAIQLKTRTFDPVLEHASFWSSYYQPMMRDGKVSLNVERCVRLQELAAAYPRTQFGRMWMQRATGFPQLSPENLQRVIDAQTTLHDVDLLTSIGARLMAPEFPLYNLAKADSVLARAERSSADCIGFRTGENIYGSMGRLDRIRSLRVRIRMLQGKHDESIAYGRDMLKQASNQYGRESITKALVEVARAKGDSALVIEFNSYALPDVHDFAYVAMDGAKGRLADHKGKVIVIDSWFLGCAGCALEHKSLNTFGQKYAGDARVVFLSLALNDKHTLKNYLTKSPLAATVVPDAESICEKLGVTAYPTHVIIDQTGKTVLWEVGGSSSSGESLGKKVAELLK